MPSTASGVAGPKRRTSQAGKCPVEAHNLDMPGALPGPATNHATTINRNRPGRPEKGTSMLNVRLVYPDGDDVIVNVSLISDDYDTAPATEHVIDLDILETIGGE